MSDTQNPPFAPFLPPNETPMIPMVEKPVANKPKRSGGSRKKKPELTQGAVQTAASAGPQQKRTRKPSTTKRAPKFDLQTILAATAGLKEADMTAFQKGLNLLLDVNKAGRGRVLAALGKVFA